MALSGTTEMLPRSDKFRVEIDGITQATWASISGITNEVNVVEQTVVQDGKQITQKRPGMRSYGEFTITKTFDGNRYFMDWWDQVREGKHGDYRRNGSIVLLDDNGQDTIARFDFVNAWIRSYNLSDLGASTDSVVTETITVVHEGLDPV